LIAHPGRRLVVTLLVTLVMVVLATGRALAIDTERAFDDPELQARYETIIRELRCLQCQNETLADSNADLAADLRREIREMVAAGKTDAEIRDFMTERYGEFVLYRPRFAANTFLLWAAPVLLLAIGAFSATRFIRRRRAEVDSDPWDSPAGPT
jgi:cytochrome c-type biogenesis protein CcmH